MIYTVVRHHLFNLIDEDISREAATAYSDDGVSLYDGIILSANDADTIERLENDAINTLVKSTADIATFTPERLETEMPAKITFDVPDFDYSFEDIVIEEISRYISLNVCAAWFQSRLSSKVEEYSNRGQVALDKVVSLLKKRKAIRRI